MLIAVNNTAPPGDENNEARTMGVVSGLGSDSDNSKQANDSDLANRIQVIGERLNLFKRLENAFGRVGWSFYPLADDSYLAVHRRWQMSTVCPDLRAAHALLKRVGGAA